MSGTQEPQGGGDLFSEWLRGRISMLSVIETSPGISFLFGKKQSTGTGSPCSFFLT